MTKHLEANFKHQNPDRVGVLLVNLGTPENPTPSAVRKYLAEFLWDSRVIDYPRPLWWLILNGIILRIRPRKVAQAYASIWTDAGSPLLVNTKVQGERVAGRLDLKYGDQVTVEIAMRYGNPNIEQALLRLRERGARRLLVLPLYPQYSGSTTATVFDAVALALKKFNWLPELRFINQYHDHPSYITALASSIREYWNTNGVGQHLLFSFHGLPKRYLTEGDPYHCQCHKTARLVAKELNLTDVDWSVGFQSRVGREEWLRPYTDEVLLDFAAD
ncbi:MAG: ferrochelatase, partial [Pseudomonadota bacterium]